jgi:peroxiredoxin
VVAAVVILFVIFRSSGNGGGDDGGGPQFVVGDPGPGEAAPSIRLPSTAGGTWDLSVDGAGKTTLLYFQEGIMCQPCWDQMRDIEDGFGDFQALGIDQMVTITVDPLDALRQKLSDEDLRTPGLSDPDVSLGPSYTANQYGMMGEGMYGHTFIVVDPDGQILWRGDYGGPPDHTMYVGPGDLLHDIRAGLAETSS